MADSELIKIISQGIDIWNKWRQDNPRRVINLRGADLTNAKLNRANLINADLGDARLYDTDLNHADLRSANLRAADLRQADLRLGNLFGADLGSAKLVNANLRGASLNSVSLFNADFSGADLSRADLAGANFNRARLSASDLSETYLSATVFADVDLSKTKGIETIRHHGASTIGIDTLIRSQGKIPEIFLRGCGLSDWEIESAKLYNPNITNQEMTDVLYRVHEIRAKQPIQISKLFISYSP